MCILPSDFCSRKDGKLDFDGRCFGWWWWQGGAIGCGNCCNNVSWDRWKFWWRWWYFGHSLHYFFCFHYCMCFEFWRFASAIFCTFDSQLSQAMLSWGPAPTLTVSQSYVCQFAMWTSFHQLWEWIGPSESDMENSQFWFGADLLRGWFTSIFKSLIYGHLACFWPPRGHKKGKGSTECITRQGPGAKWYFSTVTRSFNDRFSNCLPRRHPGNAFLPTLAKMLKVCDWQSASFCSIHAFLFALANSCAHFQVPSLIRMNWGACRMPWCLEGRLFESNFVIYLKGFVSFPCRNANLEIWWQRWSPGWLRQWYGFIRIGGITGSQATLQVQSS